MSRAPLVALLSALAAGTGISTGPDGSRVDRVAAPRVLLATIDGPITLGTAEYLSAALSRAEAERFEAVLLQLDTPGGDLESTRRIVRSMLESPVPVLVWVGPAGARAGSGGVFLALAADVTGMHPTSNIGAAHPVTGGGKDVEAEAGKDMARKVENDTVAFVRSVAEARGRNAGWAERAVRESVSITADEAVKERVVDFVAPDRDAMLAKADGRMVRVDRAGAHANALRVRGAAVVVQEPSLRQRFLMFIADPNVVAVLMLLGLFGLGIEFYHPGAIVPAVAGGFCLFLVFVASRVIPVNVAAVVLLLAGAGLLVSEAYLTAHGVAGAAGAVCLVLGMIFLLDPSGSDRAFDPAAFQVSPWVIWPTPLTLAALFLFIGWKVARVRKVPLRLGAPGMIGELGEALTEIGPGGGEAFLHGEYWRARSGSSIARGSRVRVTGVEGLVAVVEEARPLG